MPRNTNLTKAKQQAIRAMNARLPQTKSNAKGSISRFGFLKSGKPGEPTSDLRSNLRSAIGTSQRHSKRPITLAPTPWDKEKP